MRRFIAIAIVLMLGFAEVSPLLALTGATQSNLPACCRRGGLHHCAAMAGMDDAPTSQTTQVKMVVVTQRCPYGSHALPGAPHRDASLQTADAIFAGIVSHPSIAPQTESRQRISAERSRHKRGPPQLRLA